MKGLITLKDLTAKNIIEIIEDARKYKEDYFKYSDICKSQRAYLLFEKTSTRTRLSFDSGFALLGGHPIYADIRTTNLGISKLQDEIRYISRNVNIIIARMLKNSDMEVIAKYATVPFINGCCNLFHPCQVLSDIFTIYEQSKHKTNTITYVGKLNNVSRELVNALPKIGIKLYFVTKDVISVLSDENIDDKAKKSSNLICTNDFKTAVQNSNIVYTDAWIDMEFFNNPKYERNKKTITNEMLPYQVNKRVFEWNKDVCIMHDMPMHIGYEITRDIVESKSSWIFIQAENRMWVQNALMLKLLGHKIN